VRDVDVMEVGWMGSWMRGGDAGMEGWRGVLKSMKHEDKPKAIRFILSIN
jgi:hypothetical protein